MKATCPLNPEHKTFFTVADVMQEWVVDPNGEYLKTHNDCITVTRSPKADNAWTCTSCGARATVTD